MQRPWGRPRLVEIPALDSLADPHLLQDLVFLLWRN
jgi:hypothetical protein